jgi:transposase
MPRPIPLPDDVESLKRLVLESYELAEAARAAPIIEQLKVEKLRFELTCLKRARYGRSSEQLDTQIAQLDLTIEDLETSQAELPREEIVHAAPCNCPECGGALRPAGEDVSEMLEWIPGRHKVLRHVRPKFSCERCEKLVQATAPARPIARGIAGPGLLATVLVSINRIEEVLPWRVALERDAVSRA